MEVSYDPSTACTTVRCGGIDYCVYWPVGAWSHLPLTSGVWIEGCPYA